MSMISLSLVAALHLGLSILVWHAKPDSRVHRLFALQTLTFAGWSLGNVGLQSPMWLSPSMHLAFASASLIPPAFLVFAVHYPSPRPGPSPLWERSAVFAGLTFAVMSLATDWIFYDVRLTPDGLSRRPGPLYPLFGIYFLVAFSMAFGVFARKWRRARGHEQTQLNYFGVGLLIAAVGGITTNLVVPWVTGRSTVSHIGPYFGLAFIVLTAHTIIRHRFLDLRVLVHRGLAFAIAGLVSLLPVAALVTVLWPRLVTTFSVGELLLALAAVLAIGILIPVTRDTASRVLDRYFYRSHVNPQRLLREAGAALSRCVDADAVCAALMDAARRLTAPETLALYVRRDDSFVLVARAADAETRFTASPSIPPRTLQALLAGADAVLPDEVIGEVRAELNTCGWCLVLPLRADRELLGIMTLGERRSGDSFFADHIDTLVALSHAAGTALKTFELLQHRARAERLETLQRVTDGLAHELGNQLGPIKTMARLLPERHTDERFVRDFARIVGRELERMELLVARLRRLAPTTTPLQTKIDARDPMRDAIELVRALAAEREIDVHDDLGDEALPIWGDVAELEEVFLNLLTNAVEAVAATKDSAARVILRARRTGHEAVASVEDSGPGLDLRIIDKIFDPFMSTKARGSGLGLSICAGIISRHRGHITVENLPLGGAAFTVRLPLDIPTRH